MRTWLDFVVLMLLVYFLFQVSITTRRLWSQQEPQLKTNILVIVQYPDYARLQDCEFHPDLATTRGFELYCHDGEWLVTVTRRKP
jgi:hypothetical protein